VSESSNEREFVTRERYPTVTQLALLFVVTLITSIALSFTMGDPTLLATILTLLFCGFGWYIILQIQRTRDLVLATEFQNALFTSALGSNNKFCAIIKNTGAITYMDRAFHDLFDDFVKLPYRHIDAFLKYAEVQQEECDKIYAAVEHNVNDSVVFTIRTSDNKSHKIVLHIEPITRPSGYILLRARDFVEQRSAVVNDTQGAVSPSKLPGSVLQLFSGIVENDKSAFIADPNGMLIYASPTLENQLGYSEQEMLSRNFSIQDFVYVGGSKPDTLTLEDYEGEIILQKKDGSLIKCTISQNLVKDRQGRLLGCTAIMNDSNSPSGVKKKIPGSQFF
jgi:PAS domain S-box-containing protein